MNKSTQFGGDTGIDADHKRPERKLYHVDFASWEVFAESGDDAWRTARDELHSGYIPVISQSDDICEYGDPVHNSDRSHVLKNDGERLKRLDIAYDLLKICIPQLPDETAKEVSDFLDSNG
mgnify:FL=1